MTVRMLTKEGLARLIRSEVRALHEGPLGPVKWGRGGDFGKNEVSAEYERAVGLFDDLYTALQSLHAAMDASGDDVDGLTNVEDMYTRVGKMQEELEKLGSRIVR